MFVRLYLNMHFNNSLPNNSRPKEGPERYQKMTTSNTGQIKEWIWNLKKRKVMNIILHITHKYTIQLNCI